MTPRVVAALYVDPLGPYPGMPGVECWGMPGEPPRQLSLLHRDARQYAGPHPVVAHPPCGGWGSLRHLHRKGDKDCAPRAVDQVREWGGVLEHPARSLLWRHCDLPLPHCPDDVDRFGGYSVEVCQVDWGHVARKRTWLYLVRVPRAALETPPPREPTHWASGRRTPYTKPTKRAKPGLAPPGIKFCSDQQRRRTPPDFARYLVKLARAAAEARAA